MIQVRFFGDSDAIFCGVILQCRTAAPAGASMQTKIVLSLQSRVSRQQDPSQVSPAVAVLPGPQLGRLDQPRVGRAGRRQCQETDRKISSERAPCRRNLFVSLMSMIFVFGRLFGDGRAAEPTLEERGCGPLNGGYGTWAFPIAVARFSVQQLFLYRKGLTSSVLKMLELFFFTGFFLTAS